LQISEDRLKEFQREWRRQKRPGLTRTAALPQRANQLSDQLADRDLEPWLRIYAYHNHEWGLI
jgi:hypothetical protein